MRRRPGRLGAAGCVAVLLVLVMLGGGVLLAVFVR